MFIPMKPYLILIKIVCHAMAVNRLDELFSFKGRNCKNKEYEYRLQNVIQKNYRNCFSLPISDDIDRDKTFQYLHQKLKENFDKSNLKY